MTSIVVRNLFKSSLIKCCFCLRTNHLHQSIYQNSLFPLIKINGDVIQKQQVSNLSCQSSPPNCPETGKFHISHNTIWIWEKVGSLGLLVMIPAAIWHPSTYLDIPLSIILAHHHYVGIGKVLSDYARPNVIGATFSYICRMLNLLTTLVALIGCVLFSVHQTPLGGAVRSVWSVEEKK